MPYTRKPGDNTPKEAAKGAKTDPIGVHHFAVTINGLEAAKFSDVSGFEHSTKIVEYREVDNKGTIHINKVMGSTSFTEVTLKRGFTSDNALWDDWRAKVMEGDYDNARKDVTILGLNPDGSTATTFKIKNAWISKWKGPAFSAAGSTVAFEEVTFTHEGIERVKE